MTGTKRIKLLTQKKNIEEAKTFAIYERMEVDPGQIHRHPTITPILINTLGSIEKVIEVLRGSADKVALDVVQVWDNSRAEAKKKLPFEAFCLSAKTTPKAIIGIIMQAMVEQSDVATELLLAAAKKEVVAKTIKLAKTTKGIDERKIILQNRGVMAAPKNQVFNNFGSVNQDNRKQSVSIGQLDADNDKISEAVDMFNTDRVKKVGDGKAKPDFIDVLGDE